MQLLHDPSIRISSSRNVSLHVRLLVSFSLGVLVTVGHFPLLEFLVVFTTFLLAPHSHSQHCLSEISAWHLLMTSLAAGHKRSLGSWGQKIILVQFLTIPEVGKTLARGSFFFFLEARGGREHKLMLPREGKQFHCSRSYINKEHVGMESLPELFTLRPQHPGLDREIILCCLSHWQFRLPRK